MTRHNVTWEQWLRSQEGMGGNLIPGNGLGNIWEQRIVYPCMSLFSGRLWLKKAFGMLLEVFKG